MNEARENQRNQFSEKSISGFFPSLVPPVSLLRLLFSTEDECGMVIQNISLIAWLHIPGDTVQTLLLYNRPHPFSIANRVLF